MAHKDGYGAANGRRTPDKLQQPQGRRILLLPLLLALGLFSVSFACSKFLTPHGAGGRPDDNDTRCVRDVVQTNSSYQYSLNPERT